MYRNFELCSAVSHGCMAPANSSYASDAQQVPTSPPGAQPQFCWRRPTNGNWIGQAELRQLLDAEEDEYYASRFEEQGPTTVMVRNICYKYSTEDVQEQLHKLGFEGAYDFIYVPSFRTSDTNFGYFFLNLTTAESASYFVKLLQGTRFGKSKKLCEISPAEWQGLAELREHFHKKRVTSRKTGNRPLFL
jgi:hypothetical protein